MMEMESQNIEYKESWRDEYLKWVCGFANAQGGRIYIGKNDNGVTIGVDDAKRLSEDIPNKIRNHLGITCEVNLLEENGLLYVEIVVKPYGVAISYKGSYYYRSGSVKSELTGAALNDFLLKKSGLTWDEVIEERASMADINHDSIVRYLQFASMGDRLPNVNGLDDYQILEKLRLVENGKLKRAAIIMFGKDPNRFYPNVQLKIGRFINDYEFRYQEVIEGNLIKMFEDSLSILEYKFIIREVEIKDYFRVQKKGNYPREALREMVLNALVHRNYMGPMIQMRVYDDKITLWNLGQLPDTLTAEGLTQFHASYPRNPLIAAACFKATLIDSWGSGISKIMTACQKEGLPEPRFEAFQGGMLVTLFKPSIAEGDSTSQKTDTKTNQKTNQKTSQKTDTKTSQIAMEILRYIRKNPKATRKELSAYFAKTESAIQWHIEQLKTKGLICRVGSDKGGHWETIMEVIPQETLQKHVEKDEKDVEKDVEKTSEKIIKLMKEEPYITIKEIGTRLEVTRRTIEDQIKRLKQRGLVRRVGPDKGGHWEVLV